MHPAIFQLTFVDALNIVGCVVCNISIFTNRLASMVYPFILGFLASYFLSCPTN